MRRLSANDILNIWEVGLSQYPLDRAITMLLYACPDMTWEELINLSVIERDARLVDLYEQTFGKTLKGFAECPKCKERLEFALTTSDIKGRKKNDLVVNEYFLDLIEDEIQLKFRFPNSIDIAAVIAYEDIQTAQNSLAKRCIIQAIQKGKSISENELPSDVINRLAEYMDEYEHNAEILLDLKCLSCNHCWQMPLDMVLFLWKEISSYARHLLQEVHCLASAYGWCEEAVISMSPVKRRYYLEMVL